jgi:hypothetical protein
LVEDGHKSALGEIRSDEDGRHLYEREAFDGRTASDRHRINYQSSPTARRTLKKRLERTRRDGVAGSEEMPLNLWSIVLLTNAPDPRYCEPFEQMVRAGLLPGFIEIYIERDLKLKLSRI